MSGLPLQSLPYWGLQLITGMADFIRHVPANALGARQHPQQGPLLTSSDGGVSAVVVAVGKQVAERRDPPPVCFGREECESGFNARVCGGGP
jgi:hypothetical protein